jgi:general secretion pathway protein L
MKTTSIENYKTSLARLKKQLLASRFLRWWLGELSSMVPSWMRSPIVTANSFVLVPLDQANAPWDSNAGDAQRELALTLPPNLLLRKVINLPLATEENLRQVLEFQLEQHTPFAPSQVYFGYCVLARNFEIGQLTVELVVTPRNGVDAAMKALNDAGSPVRAVFAADMLDTANLVNLLPSALGKKPFPLKQGANPWLAALVVLMALAAMAVPLVIKREAVVQMFPWVEKAKAAAETVDGLRRDLEARVEQHNYLLQKRQTLPTVIQTIEELTRILPDGTWVQSIDIRDKEVQVQGETNASVKLIGLFEQSSIFRDASFRSPLTKVNISNNERYHLSLQIRPEEPTAPASGAVSAPEAAQQLAVQPAHSASTPVPPASAPASVPRPIFVSSAPAQKASEAKMASPSVGGKP